MPPVIFFGTDNFSLPTLRSLIEHDYKIEAVVTKTDGRSGRGRVTSSPEVKVLAQQHGIPVHQPASKQELIQLSADFTSELGVVVAYGSIIPQEALNNFSHGLINIHPSLLPKYRGPAPIEAAIKNGDRQTAISIMRLEAGMDTGPIYVQKLINLNGDEIKPNLYNYLSVLGAELLIETLPKIIDHSLNPIQQAEFEEAPTVTRMIQKSDGIIDWVMPAEAIQRCIRAYFGWPGSRTTILGTEATIISAHAGDSRPMVGTGESGGTPGTPFKTVHGELAIVTGHGELIIDVIKPAGKSEMSGQAFLAGRRL